MLSPIAFSLGAAFASVVFSIQYRFRSRKPTWSHTSLEFIYNPTVLLLEANLRSSERMMRLITDNDFAQQLADILASPLREFCTRGGEILLRCGSDDARAVIAHLRNRGEDYLSFLHGVAPRPLKTAPALVLFELAAIGWREPTKAELAALRAVEELSLANGRAECASD